MRIIARTPFLALALLGCNADTIAVEDLPAEQAAAFCDLFLRCGPGQNPIYEPPVFWLVNVDGLA